MRRTILVLLSAAVLLAAAVVALAPASLVAARVTRVSGIAMGEVEGTLWRGRGVLAAGNARLPLAWTLDAAPLLTGELRVHLTPIDGASTFPRADIAAGNGRLTLRDVDIVFPASLLATAIARNATQPAGWTADGEIAVTSSRLDWAPPAGSGDLRVVWRSARLALAAVAVVDLGELAATLVANGDRLAGPVANRGGDLDLRGDLMLQANGDAAISLVATPRRATDAALAGALAAIGTADGAGWRVHWQTPRR